MADGSSISVSTCALHVGQRVDKWSVASRNQRRISESAHDYSAPDRFVKRGGASVAVKSMSARQMEAFKYVFCLETASQELFSLAPLTSSYFSYIAYFRVV